MLVDPPFIGGCQGLLHVTVKALDHVGGAGVVSGRTDFLGT